MKDNLQIRYAENSDKNFWFSLDKHMPESEFYKKVRDRQGYVLFEENRPVGILRYNLFWDNTPFCNLLYIKEDCRSKGYGRLLTEHWENEMRLSGYKIILTSTQSDEGAQHFYRKTGYVDCGSLTFPNQADELFLCKFLSV